MRNSLQLIGAILRTEVLMNLNRVAPWALLALFVGNAVLWYGAGPAISRGWAPNSEVFIAGSCAVFTFLTTPFFVALLMGDPVIRDFRLGVAPLLFAQPISKAEYLTGKFLGNFLTLLGCCAGFTLTMFLLQAWHRQGMIVLPWRVYPHVKHFVILIGISNFALAAFCFAVGTLTRSARLVYGLIACFYVFYIGMMSTVVRVAPRWRTVADLLLLDQAHKPRRELSAAVLNQMVITYSGDALTNRIIVVAIGLLCLTIVYLKFSADDSRAARSNASTTLLGLATTEERLYVEDLAIGYVKAITEPGPQWDTALEKTPLPEVVIAEAGPALWLKQFAAVLGVEFRLLCAERSLIVLIPLVVFLCGLNSVPFHSAVHNSAALLSASYAAGSVNSLLILLFGIIVLYTGEALDRDDELGVKPLLWSAPVGNGALLLSKFSAIFLLALVLATLTALAVVGLQMYRSGASVELGPYVITYVVVLLPSLALIGGIAILLNVVLRNKYLAHAAGIALGGIMFYLFTLGHIHWLYNPVLYQLWSYERITTSGQYRQIVLLHRVYWLAITVACLALAHLRFQRVQGK